MSRLSFRNKHAWMDIEVDVPEPVPANLGPVLDNLGVILQAKVKGRVHNGVDAWGRAMQRPKDRYGKQPLVRSGQLMASIAYEVRGNEAKGDQYLVVEPMGSRIETRNAKSKIKDYKATIARAQARLAVASKLKNKRLIGSARGTITRAKNAIAKAKFDVEISNFKVAAILMNPPKDKKSVKGNRQIYDVFKLSDAEYAFVLSYLKREIKWEWKT